MFYWIISKTFSNYLILCTLVNKLGKKQLTFWKSLGFRSDKLYTDGKFQENFTFHVSVTPFHKAKRVKPLDFLSEVIIKTISSL